MRSACFALPSFGVGGCSRERHVLIRLQTCGKRALGLAIALSLMPGVAAASVGSESVDNARVANVSAQAQPLADAALAVDAPSLISAVNQSKADALLAIAEEVASDGKAETVAQDGGSAKKRPSNATSASADRSKTDKVLDYDRRLIKKVGTQEATGHTICCPSFSCAYGDVVLDGTVHGHEYYSCSCCTWTDWGGGGSSDRCVGTDEELLREAYDQIRSGRPTIIHVAGSSGEHWICLIGYRKAKDPDRLDLSNFIALDPWDGAQIVASDRYTLYGDGCEHVSDR